MALLEREKFPRYHIGESLLPFTYFPMETTGVIERLKKSAHVKKYSVQFVSQDGRVSQPFYFFNHFTHEAAQTWQVLRSEFDQALLDNAREKGADVFEETNARDLIRNGDGAVAGVRAESKDGAPLEFHAPITIDATGRDALTVTRNGWKIRDPYLNKIAVWTYYEGALRDQGYDEGATTVAYVPDKGWFWYIPLHSDIVSVGVVAEKDYLYQGTRDLAEIFYREVKKNVWIEQHLACGRQTGPFRVTGEYSYRSRYSAADGVILTGDAFAFLDPVFSSGVFIALYSGEQAALCADAAIARNDFSAAQFSAYSEKLCQSIEAMRALVYAFYDHRFSFRKLIDKYPHLAKDVTDCLIGNLLVDFGPLQKALAEFASLPEELPYGRPLVAETANT